MSLYETIEDELRDEMMKSLQDDDCEEDTSIRERIAEKRDGLYKLGWKFDGSTWEAPIKKSDDSSNTTG